MRGRQYLLRKIFSDSSAITPPIKKDFPNPHLSCVWKAANFVILSPGTFVLYLRKEKTPKNIFSMWPASLWPVGGTKKSDGLPRNFKISKTLLSRITRGGPIGNHYLLVNSNLAPFNPSLPLTLVIKIKKMLIF